ncbi:MAG: hypothetical protein II503_01065, partial [Clostridia bacterium]|nr:hypothetical protein [Clostridia bacterium]
MAKKKTIDLRSVDPTPVPAGDVNIIYNGVRIGGFSEDTEATLKTAGCRVEQDINVNYTKPSGSAIGNTVNLSTDIVDERIIIKGAFIDTTGVYSFTLQAEADNPGSTLALCEEGRDGYSVILTFESEEDFYSMTVNGTPVTFDRGAYTFISSP